MACPNEFDNNWSNGEANTNGGARGGNNHCSNFAFDDYVDPSTSKSNDAKNRHC